MLGSNALNVQKQRFSDVHAASDYLLSIPVQAVVLKDLK